MSNVVGLRGIVAPDGDRTPHAEVVEQAEKLLEMARSGEIIGIQSVVIHSDATAVSLFRAGSYNYAAAGMLTAAAHGVIDGA